MATLTHSERLYHVLKKHEISVMGFARRIDLPPLTGSKQLYSILHNNRRITKPLAKKINALLPQYSIDWLVGKAPEEDPQNI